MLRTIDNLVDNCTMNTLPSIPVIADLFGTLDYKNLMKIITYHFRYIYIYMINQNLWVLKLIQIN